MHYKFIQKLIWHKRQIFLINVFAENGHSITILERVTKKYMNNITSKKGKVNIETIKNDKTVKLPWVPKLGPKLRKEF